MSDTEQTELTLEDAQAALRKVRKADAAKRVKIDALEEQLEAGEAKLAALTAYEALGTPDDLKARLAAGDAASKALEESGVSLEELPARIKEAKEAATLRRERDLDKAAASLGKPSDALAEIVGDKPLSVRTVKGEDGKEVEQWLIGEGDAAKPLAEMKSIQLLGAAQPDKPAPAPLPTGQRGGTAPTAKTVEQRTAEVKREISI